MRSGGVHKLRLQYLAFFDHLPPCVYIFYGIKVYKKSIFLTAYPPPLVNVVCERPLIRIYCEKGPMSEQNILLLKDRIKYSELPNK